MQKINFLTTDTNLMFQVRRLLEKSINRRDWLNS